jgi:DNA-binding SARP family transcriptional activator
VEIRVLGEVEVWRADVPLCLARRQQRLLLGILAIEANELITIDRLIDLLWGDQPPRQARAVLQSRMSELRTALHAFRGPDDELEILTRGSGYLLKVDPDLVDAYRFQSLVAAARVPTSPEEACRSLRAALDLWQGPVLGGRLTAHAHAALCSVLESERLTAAEDLFEIELQLGRHYQVADEIRELADANPERERLVAQMMLALHRAGRTADALHTYDRWRRWLADELGIDPAAEVQRLYLAMLRADPDLLPEARQPVVLADRIEAVRTVPRHPAANVTVPQILPPGVADFIGRAAEMAFLRKLFAAQSRERCAVVAVSGPAGIGKTALSVQVAHALRPNFPDGQLFANLRGAAEGRPADPAEVMGRFLRALGVDGAALPETMDERVDLYRDLLSERSVMIVLDNADSDEQVLPLIPSGPACGVIVNGRPRLGPALGAGMLNLDVLAPAEASRLLARIAGPDRVEAEPGAADHLCAHCGYLPLAVRVSAAKLAAKPHWRIEKLLGLLKDKRSRLNHLVHGHLDVRASIALSYVGLDANAQRLLRRLGALDLPEVSVWLSAALLDTTLTRAEDLLEQLFDAQLVEIAGQDQIGHALYKMHDLVRLFARELAQRDEPAGELDRAYRRALGARLALVKTPLHGASAMARN